MAVIKVACPQCGQKVSGDESFYGTSVQCPICSAQIPFPTGPGATNAHAEAMPTPQQPVQTVPPPPGMGSPAPAPQQSIPQPQPQPQPEYGSQMPVSPYAMPRPTVAPSGSSAQEDPPGPMPMITMITGIVAFACAMAPLAGPAAIIMGHLTLIKVNARKDQKGKGMTIAGLVLGYSSLVLLLLVAIIWVNFVGPMVMKEQ